MLTYDQLQLIKRRIASLNERGQIMDANNYFERRELQSVIKELKYISQIDSSSSQSGPKKDRKLKLVLTQTLEQG